MKYRAMDRLESITGAGPFICGSEPDATRIVEIAKLSTRNCVAGYPYQAILCKITSR